MRQHETKPADPVLLAPILRTGIGYWVLVAFLAAVVAWGFYAWVQQLMYGLGVTGMNRPIYWGLYITNFVFFIGISHAGTLISAILRVAGAEWRRPITRAAEAITVFALLLGVSQILADMGRVDRILNLIIYGRFQSPLLWDVLSIGMYFFGSIAYLYLPMIPDLAILRDQLPAHAAGWRRALYRALALGWHGGAEQRRRLEKAIGIMAILIIPLAVSVHTVVSWIFGMTLQPMWHTTILGPYFVIGAIYSGIATIIIAMAVIRKVFHLEGYLKPLHFNYLGLLLVVFNVLWFYFTLAEYLTTGYQSVIPENAVLLSKWSGEFTLVFWGMIASMALAFAVIVFPRLVPAAWARATSPGFRRVAVGAAALLALAALVFVLPSFTSARMNVSLQDGLRLAIPVLVLILLVAGGVTLKERVIAQVVFASLLVDLGMWLERFTIVVPTESRPQLGLYTIGVYQPTWVEWAITAAAFAGFALIYALFVKVFPIISIWEVAEAPEAIESTVEKLRSYLPGAVPVMTARASSPASGGGAGGGGE
jgi:molybdopterin-containing oxidoreductase family membrane subunit